MPKLTKGLSLKQERFVDSYLGDAKGNGTKAAQLAGYRGSWQTLKAVGSENLAKPDIAKEIDKRLRTTMTGEEVLRELSEIASAECRDRVRVTDKLKALELMGKHHGLYNERVDVTVEQIERRDLTLVLQAALFDVVDVTAESLLKHSGLDCQRIIDR